MSRRPNDATRITATVQEPVTATLMIETPSGSRPATEGELRQFGFFHAGSLIEYMNDLLVQLYNYHGEGVVERDDLTRGGTPYLNLIRYLFDSLAGGLHSANDILTLDDWSCLRHLVALDVEYRKGNTQFDLTKVDERD